MALQRKLFDIVKSFHPEETLSKQLLVVMYELGDLAKCVQRTELEPENKKLYHAEAIKATMDLITQLRITCEYLGVNFERLKKLGYLELKERSKKWKKKE